MKADRQRDAASLSGLITEGHLFLCSALRHFYVSLPLFISTFPCGFAALRPHFFDLAFPPFLATRLKVNTGERLMPAKTAVLF